MPLTATTKHLSNTYCFLLWAAVHLQVRRWLHGEQGGKASSVNLGMQHNRFYQQYADCLAEVMRSRTRAVCCMTTHVSVISSSTESERAHVAGLAANPAVNMPECKPDDMV